MKAIVFLAIIQAIFILNQEINAAKTEPDRLDERIFVDEDSTDYNAYSLKTKRETDLPNKPFTSAEKDGILNFNFKSIYKLNSGKARTNRKVSILDPVSVDLILKMIYKPNLKQDNDKSGINVIEHIETKFRRLDKANPEISKELQRQISSPKITPISLLGKHLISVLRRQNNKHDDGNKEIVRHGRKENKETGEENNEFQLKPESAAKEERRTKHNAGVKDRHNKKVDEIMQFLEKNHMSTNYVYDEIERIKADGEVKDQLRRLVVYLEEPENAKLKESVLKCFYDTKKVIDKKSVDIWNVNSPNNLIIHDLRDPYTELV